MIKYLLRSILFLLIIQSLLIDNHFGQTPIANRHTFTLNTSDIARKHFVFRDGEPFFAIGTFFDALEKKDSKFERVEFEAYKLIFNTIWISEGDLNNPALTVFPSILVPWLTADSCVFLFGDIDWRIHYDFPTYDQDNNSIIDPCEMLDMINDPSIRNQFNNTDAASIMTGISNLLTDSRSLIFKLYDEPDHGGAHWSWCPEILTALHEQKNNARTGSLTYLDLGPMSGSNYLWGFFTHPAAMQPTCGQSSYLNYNDGFGTDYRRNLQVTIDGYKESADIFSVNSYSLTINDPKLLGDAVDTIFTYTQKPVWPWVSFEGGDYTSESQMQSLVRRQMYSALAHYATGIQFFGNTANSSVFNSDALDVIKEIKMYEFFLKHPNYFWVDNNGQLEWRIVQWVKDSSTDSDNRFLIIANNRTSNSQTLSFPNNYMGGGSITVPANGCGLWTKHQERSTITQLIPLGNLGFEKDMSLVNQRGNWYNPSSNNISLTTSKSVLGSKCLSITTATKNSVYVKQEFDCIPGATYNVTAWYWNDGDYTDQNIILKTIANGVRYESPSEPLTECGWTLVKRTLTAPANSSTMEIQIGKLSVTTDAKPLVYYWDEIVVSISEFDTDIDNESSGLPKNSNNTTLSFENNTEHNFSFSTYPNPFNADVAIGYVLSEENNIRIEIFNIDGILVETLIDKVHQKGNYEIKWNAEKYPSGIYFCRLSSGSKVLTKKMILLK